MQDLNLKWHWLVYNKLLLYFYIIIRCVFAARNILLWVKGGKHLVDTFQCHLQPTESDENNMADPFSRPPAAVGGRLKTGVSHSCRTVSDEKAWQNGSISSSVHHFFGTLQIIGPK